MEWASLVVAIVAALAAGVGVLIARQANRTSKSANSLAAAANSLAEESNKIAAASAEQEMQLFAMSGPRVTVSGRVQQDTPEYGQRLAVKISSVGRQPATVEQVVLEVASDAGSVRRLEDIVSLGHEPELPPSQSREYVVEGPTLAAALGEYGSHVTLRVGVAVGGHELVWSAPIRIALPGEPLLAESLADFNGRAMDVIRWFNLAAGDYAPSEVQWARTQLELLSAELPVLQHRYRSRRDRGLRPTEALTSMSVNAESRVREIRGMLGRIR